MKRERKEKSVKNDKSQFGFKNLLSKYWPIIGAFFVIVIIKVILSLSMYSPFIIPDELYYDSIAQNVLNGSLSPKIASPIGPGYPVLLSIAYMISDNKAVAYHLMLVISGIVSTSIIFPAYIIIKKYCSDRVAIIGAITITLLPFMNFFSQTLMTENLFTPLFIFSLWFFLESLSSDNKIWQGLTSASVVYLYITRSNAIAMIVGLLIAIAYYAVVSSKSNLVDALIKKSYMLITLVVFLLSWLIFSLDSSRSVIFALIMVVAALGISCIIYMLMDNKRPLVGNVLKNSRALTIGAAAIGIVIIATFVYMLISGKGFSSMNFGSSYPVADMTMSLFQMFDSLDNLVIGSVVFLNEILYVMVCSFFISTVVIFYHLFYQNKTYTSESPLSAGLVYVIASLLVIALTVVGMKFYGSESIILEGRYVEPIISAILIFSIIYLYDIKKISDKHLLQYLALFIGTFIISLFLLEIDYSVINGFNEYVNNPAIIYLEPLYKLPLPELWVLIYALAFMALIYISIKNKKYINVLLAFVILSSLIPSATLYGRAVDSGSFRMDNQINLYLNANSNKDTHLYIDENMTYIQQKAGMNIYAFWNKGYNGYLDLKTIDMAATTRDNAYLISVNTLPYPVITNDDVFKLYRI